MNPSPIPVRSPENRTRFISGLYGDLMESGIRYFFPGAVLERVPQRPDQMPGLLGAVPSGGQVEFEWMGAGYSLTVSSNLSDHERRLLRSIGMVLSALYQLITNQALAAQSFQLFRGLPEDRFVSAFLDPSPHTSGEAIAGVPDHDLPPVRLRPARARGSNRPPLPLSVDPQAPQVADYRLRPGLGNRHRGGVDRKSAQ